LNEAPAAAGGCVSDGAPARETGGHGRDPSQRQAGARGHVAAGAAEREN